MTYSYWTVRAGDADGWTYSFADGDGLARETLRVRDALLHYRLEQLILVDAIERRLRETERERERERDRERERGRGREGALRG